MNSVHPSQLISLPNPSPFSDPILTHPYPLLRLLFSVYPSRTLSRSSIFPNRLSPTNYTTSRPRFLHPIPVVCAIRTQRLRNMGGMEPGNCRRRSDEHKAMLVPILLAVLPATRLSPFPGNAVFPRPKNRLASLTEYLR